ncbi:ATP-binding protein [Catenulispora yoronensis]
MPTDDELGDLAQAFNKVQETALLMLERQVTIRRNTAEMFGNVGHRIHNLTGRQLSIIDQVERSETDPVLLDRLYRIDHLAVRLQRGADSLILLSGEREANISGSPMRLTDVVRSAVGRVEGYQRVVLIAEDDAMVAPSAVGDLTLMVAELVENAVSFSPASQRVEIAVGLSARGFVIEIVDRGMGMSPEQMAQENARLVRRERLDLAPTRVLGLFVVGRLSVRTGAAVELSATPGGGTTARVYVPGFLLAGPVAEAAGTRAPRGDAVEAAATGTPAVAAGPAGNGVPALPGPTAHAALLPARPHGFGGEGLGPDGWPSSGVAPAGPDGLPRRIPGRTPPIAPLSPLTPVAETFGGPIGNGAAAAAAAGQPASTGAQPEYLGMAGPPTPAGPGAGYGDRAPQGAGHGAERADRIDYADYPGYPAAAGPGRAEHTVDHPHAAQADGRSAQPSFQPHPLQASSPAAGNGNGNGRPPAAGLDGSSLQVSGFDAIALPVPSGPSDAPGARYSLGPLAPVPVDGLGRRRSREPGGEHLPHQPVPEPRRESEHLPSRWSPVAPPPAAPPAEASPLVNPHLPPPPEPPRFAAGPGGAASAPPAARAAPQSATAPQASDNALPRRVRKAPAQPDWPTAPLSAVTGPAQPQDAVAVRDALLEYEAGVERALYDSADDMPTRRPSARHAGPAPERDGEDQ